MGHKFKKLALLTGYLLLTTSYTPASAMDHSGRTKHNSARSEISANAPTNAANAPADDDPFARDRYPVSYEITGPGAPAAAGNAPAAQPNAAPGASVLQYAPAAPAQPHAATNGAISAYAQPSVGGQVVLQPQIAAQLPFAYQTQQVVGYAVVNGQVVAVLGTPNQVVGYPGQPVITYQQPNVMPGYATAPTAAYSVNGQIVLGQPAQPTVQVLPNGMLIQQSGQQLPQIVGQPLPMPPAQAAPAPYAGQKAEAAPIQEMPEELLRALPSSGNANSIERQASKEILRDLPTASLRGLVVNVRKKNSTSPAMPVAGATGAPIGYVQFCRENRSECGDKTSSPGIVKLSRALWNEVVAVNAFVNGAIEPVTDEELYNTAEKWTFPKGGRGDCEDYVLLKRRLLMDRGWPASALLITVVRDENGGHAVLTVRTDQGDFILDNQESKVLAWYQTPYRYIKRQSESEAMRWVSIQDDRPFNVGSIRK